MNNIKRSIYILILICSLKAESIRPLINVGYDVGIGDLILKDNSVISSTITGGDGLNMNIGLSADLLDGFELQALVGYKYKSLGTDNSKNLSNLQVSSILFLRGTRIKVGVGVSYYIKPKFVNTDTVYEFKNTFAGIMQVEYQITPIISAGVKTTFVNYERLNENDKNVITNGQSIGFFLTFVFD